MTEEEIKSTYPEYTVWYMNILLEEWSRYEL